MLCQKSKYAQSVVGLYLSVTQLEDVQCAIHPLLKAYVQDVANTATISMVNDTTVWRAEMKSVEYAKWRRRRVYDRFDAWLELITFVKKPLITLTEAQWLNACRYFNGCAFCESEIIDTRALFIPFKNGGKYCDWNVVPQCQKCANRRILKNNPFTSMQNYKKDRERLERIVNYLLPLLERSLE